MTDGRFAVLVVCHANLCRSPMAERLTRRALAGWPGIEVSSAGTHARGGSDMHPAAAQVLSELHVDAGGFVSRELTPGLVAAADLVLTADRGQRSVCATMVPDAVTRIFTLRQYARMAAALGPPPDGVPGDAMPGDAMPGDGVPGDGVLAVPSARLRAQLLHVVRGRGRLQPVPPQDDDLADPVRQPIEAFRACAADIQRSLDAMLGPVLGPITMS